MGIEDERMGGWMVSLTSGDWIWFRFQAQDLPHPSSLKINTKINIFQQRFGLLWIPEQTCPAFSQMKPWLLAVPNNK